jgi:hypothetical protein
VTKRAEAFVHHIVIGIGSKVVPDVTACDLDVTLSICNMVRQDSLLLRSLGSS